MRIVTAPSKPNQIAAHLRKKILLGKLIPGTRLAPVRELTKEFGVSRKVIVSAFDILEKEQLIIRKDRSGILVANKDSRRQKTIALLMTTSDHIYQKQNDILFSELQKQGFLSLVVNTKEFKHDPAGLREILENLLLRDLDGLIIDGVGEFPFDLLIEYEKKLPRLVFINRCENSYPFNALKVTIDAGAGAHLATKHLTDSGYKKIMLMAVDPVNFINSPNYHLSDHYKMITGYQQALAGAGLDQQIFYSNNQNSHELKQLLSDAERPDAIFSTSDFLAKQAIDVCKDIDLKIPEGLAIIGYWNTPWTEMLEVPLSSVSVQEELIVNTVAAKITAEDFVSEKILVPPQLMIRESSTKKTLTKAI